VNLQNPVAFRVQGDHKSTSFSTSTHNIFFYDQSRRLKESSKRRPGTFRSWMRCGDIFFVTFLAVRSNCWLSLLSGDKEQHASDAGSPPLLPLFDNLY
jgi:hypothetical protein